MFKRHLLNVALTALLCIAGSVNALADSMTFTTKGVTTSSKTLNYSESSQDEYEGITWSYDDNCSSNGGVMIAKNQTANFTLNNFTKAISKVTINVTSYSNVPTITLYDGETQWDSKSPNKSTTASYDFSGSSAITGTLKIQVKNAGNTSIIKSITVEYSSLPQPEMSFGTASYDLTRGIDDAEDFEGQTVTIDDNLAVTYSSSDENVIMVDANSGEATYGDEEGTAIITATFAGNETYGKNSASYTVSWKKQTSTLTFTESAYENLNLATSTFKGQTATLTPNSEQSKVTYASSSDNIVMVDATTGEVLLISEGEATIIATYAGTSIYSAATASYTISTVKQPTTLSFDKATFNLNLNYPSYKNFVAQTATLTDGPVNAEITYESDNAAVAKVEDNVVTLAGAAGTAVITATYAGTGAYASSKATYEIVVVDPSISSVVDVITPDSLVATSTSYKDFTNVQVTSSAVYAGNTANGSSAIQMRKKSGSGIWTTASGGSLKKVSVIWNSSTADGRYLTIYGNDKAYTSQSTLGTNLGTIVCGTSTELEVKTGNYQFISIVASDPLYLEEIQIEWGLANDADPYTRSVAAGSYGTICLAKAVAAEDIEGATIYSIAGKRMNGDKLESIALEEVTDGMEAGKGYIFQATYSDQAFIMKGEATSEVAEGPVMGNLNQEAVQTPQGMYVIYNNQVRKLNGATANVPQYFAYLNLTDVDDISQAESEVRGLKMIGSYDFVTAINGVEAGEQANETYDLQGRRVQRTAKKGLYIVNGKKIVK